MTHYTHPIAPALALAFAGVLAAVAGADPAAAPAGDPSVAGRAGAGPSPAPLAGPEAGEWAAVPRSGGSPNVRTEPPLAAGASDPALADEVVAEYCARCHNERRLRGNLSLEGFTLEGVEGRRDVAEKMIRKLRAGMMPPPGAKRPAADTLAALAETLEGRMDEVAAADPNPGRRTFQRLNRAEYRAAVRDLLDLDVDAAAWLPPDTRSEGFDNVADAQMPSPTSLTAYLNAAEEIARLAVGDPNVAPAETRYVGSGYRAQWDRVPGAPFGTRGGIVATHHFPADGEYRFRVTLAHTTTGNGFFGRIARFERIEISIDGEPVATLDVDPWMDVSDPEGISLTADPAFVRAGPRRVAAAFVKRSEGPVEDLLSPHEWSLADRHTGIAGYGLTLLPHVQDVAIRGPYGATGVSETPSRRRIFTCRPAAAAEAPECARRIVERLAERAYRRPLAERDVEGLMTFYREGVAEGGFEVGVRTALQAMLASLHFVFRFEPAAGKPGRDGTVRIADQALASRLSFFLWGAPPDARLVELAERGELGEERALLAEARRMLADDRAEALATRFAAQWLRLQDLDKVHPDAFWFPDYHQQLADAMRRETELFFWSLVREDRSLLDLYAADYTYVNERLARHYGMEGVVGEEFRRVEYADDRRRGILGHGSVLTLTSHANRTSPVLRGKWVMEVLMGTPPPPPPPGVPDLEETGEVAEGRRLTTRERMELHRANPTCNACHRFMDPIGLALDNFDVTGRWRIRENGMELDTRGDYYDGTAVSTPAELRAALLARPIPLVRTFVENLMAYALGRRVEYYDQPAVRRIAEAAAGEGYRMRAFILGVVESDAFRRAKVEGAVVEEDAGAGHQPAHGGAGPER